MLKKISSPLAGKAIQPNIDGLNKLYAHICLFDSNVNPSNAGIVKHPQLLAVGCLQELAVKTGNDAFAQLQQFCDRNQGWKFGYLSYDLKNETEELKSESTDGLAFPLLHFFSPKVVIETTANAHILHFDDEHVSEEEAKAVYKAAYAAAPATAKPHSVTGIKNRITKEEYLSAFNELKSHISRGDIYEINFCQEFFSEHAEIDPPEMYARLNRLSEAPFAAFCRFGDHYLLSSSPERFLQKKGATLISQPIKGTIRRAANPTEDERLKSQLRNDPKEQNENVMIVDLVRNDLSRIAKKGTVQVDELFGIYSFKQVHQMISTVSCGLKENTSFTEILKATFPMGSMTGAPKVRAMQLIEQYESMKRGLYSGAVGYIDPAGDFDLSVVIRSILYNSANHYLSFMTGSAITSNADGEQEYAECLLKARAMFDALK
ncbi:MAG: anthranilate synthase component family protein [Bacteroidetes bacterium]|nr:anthranilate synthase component family protein [Bacteroidota bacterium]